MSSYQRSQATISAPANYLRVLRERWVIVLLTVLVCVTAGVLSERSTAKKYSAQSDLLISPVDNGDSTFVGINVFRNISSDPTSNVLTLARYLNTPATAQLVRRNLHLRQSAGSLLGMISVQPLSQTDIVSRARVCNEPGSGGPARERVCRRDDRQAHAAGSVGRAEGRHQAAGADQPERRAFVTGRRSRPTAPRRPEVADRTSRPERRRAQPRRDADAWRIRSRPSSSSWRRRWQGCCSASGSRSSQTRSAGRSAARTTSRPGPASRSWRGSRG